MFRHMLISSMICLGLSLNQAHAKEIRLVKPDSGQTQTILALPDDELILDFSPNESSLERDGDDMIIRFNNGAQIILQGFYVDLDSTPVIPDSSQVDADVDKKVENLQPAAENNP